MAKQGAGLGFKHQLARARAALKNARAELAQAKSRERSLRAEVARLQARLHDAGLADAPASRRGYRSIDAALCARMIELKAAGKSNGQIGRLLGCSTATVSLVSRGKYPTAAAKAIVATQPLNM
ncbi:MAG: hypothetical protein IT529_06135 [Burkholderiales bacterium]|nr:hypothetical protein [Burkholderiales bacterium]